MFAELQVEAARANAIFADVNLDLFLASNTMGGVIGKMISPQSLAIAAASSNEHESTLFKKVIKMSLVLLFVLCVVVFLCSTPLYFLVP